MYIGRRCHLLGLVPLLFSVLSLHSQTASPDSGNPATIKTKVRLALVDVVVTNDKGDSVTGLHKGDFQVLEDGKPQTISTFEEHHGGPPTQIKLPTLPPHVYTNFPVSQTSDAVNVLLLDAMNTPRLDQAYVHTQMINYLKTIPPSTRVAIFTLASRLRMLQGVTTDSSELLKVLNSVQAGPQESSLLPSDGETEAIHHFIGFVARELVCPYSGEQRPSGDRSCQCLAAVHTGQPKARRPRRVSESRCKLCNNSLAIFRAYPAARM